MFFKRDWKIRLGFAPTRRMMYDPSYSLQNKREIRQAVEGLCGGRAELIDIDWLNEEGILIDPADVPAVARRFREAGVEALFMPHCNFGSEEVVAMLGKAMGVPVLLWGPRDKTPPIELAVRQTDTQCGLFASAKGLQRYGVPFTYIENCHVADAAFRHGLLDFLRVASAVREFRRMRIGQVNTRPKPFLSVMINEGELLEKFGIEVVPFSTSEAAGLAKKFIATNSGDVAQFAQDIKDKVDCSAMLDGDITAIAATEMAFLELARLHNLNAMASECWFTFREAMGIGVCFLFGDLTDRGLPVGCETDIHGAVTSALLNAAAMGDTVPFLADLTIRHPSNDNAELLWHCGPFPQSLAKDPALRCMRQHKGFWELKGGDITIARFDGLRGSYSLFAGAARGVDGPSTNGNYLWAETSDWVKWEKKFIYGPYIHHVSCAHGKFTPIMREASRYMGVEFDTAD